MRIPPAAQTLLLVGALVGVSLWGLKRCSGEQEARQAADQLRTDKKADSTLLLFRALLSEKDAANLKSQRDQAKALALRDDAGRTARDDNTAMLTAAMSRTMQEVAAIKGLVSNNLLPASRYADTTLSVVPKDSQYVAAVAAQGRILTDTRAEVKQMGVVVRANQQQISDLERILNGKDAAITDVRTYVQDRVDERGLFRGKSKKQFREIDRRLGETQKIR